MVRNYLRKLKRMLLYDGHAGPVYRSLKSIAEVAVDDPGNRAIHIKGKYVVNLSFDLEFALNTRFWAGEKNKAVSLGIKARKDMVRIEKMLKDKGVNHNVQIVGALLTDEPKNYLELSSEGKSIMAKYPELFRLSNEERGILDNEFVDGGLHGFSHKSFYDISREEADNEIKQAAQAFRAAYGRKAEFMSYPKNNVAHEEILVAHGIKFYRSHAMGGGRGKVPLGFWFSPNHFTVEDLRRLLMEIRSCRDGYFLHLWGHYTEMCAEQLLEYINVIKSEGWEFDSISRHTNHHGV